MKTAEAMARLLGLWRRVADTARAQALLEWDQETVMPPRGVAHRASALETLAGLHHAQVTAPELGEAIACLEENLPDLDPLEAAHVREAARGHRRACRLPRELVEKSARATALGLEAWKKARQAGDFAPFSGPLAEILSLKRAEARCLLTADQEELYDALLEEYEPGLATTAVERLFAELQGPLVHLTGLVRESGRRVDTSPFRGHLPREKQLAFCRHVVAAMGFDLDAGRIDPATHPFCSGHGPGDVRLTWRCDEGDLRPALFGLIHEAGHGLYEQGLDPGLDRTPAGDSVSLGIHESQSRLWENLVGRSHEFWEAFEPELERRLPGRNGAAALFAAANEVRPSLIRTEADEVTYNLHILLRFDLERALLREELAPADLPAAWEDRLDSLLGIRPPDPVQGVLQDIHWAMGAIGYFPTYTLGNLYAAQLFEAARNDLTDLSDRIRRRELLDLREWLRAKIHRHGSILPAPELIGAATGRPATSAPLLAHLARRLEAVYGLTISDL